MTKLVKIFKLLPNKYFNLSRMRSTIVFLILLILVLFSSFKCSSVCNGNCTNVNLGCDCCPTVDSVTKEKPSLNKVYVFLETSGSMSGYMPSRSKTTTFQQVVPNIISRVGEQYETHFYDIKESSLKPASIDLSDASLYVSTGRFAPWGQHTAIPTMLDTIANYQNTNDVTILISDMIYSPEEEKLVGQSITEISKHVNKKTSAASLLALTSDFSSKINLSKAPYYILIQGKSENIEAVKNKIIESINLYKEDYQEINFGYNYSTPFYSVIPYADIMGTWQPAPCGEKKDNYLVIKDVQSDTIAFWVGIDLKNLPNYCQDLGYLRPNTVISPNGIKAEITEFVDKANFEKTLDDETEKAVAANCTHFIKIKAFDFEDNIGQIGVSINSVEPFWIKSFNHDNAEQADVIRDSTFGLQNIFIAMKDAFHETSKRTFFKDFKIIVVKK